MNFFFIKSGYLNPDQECFKFLLLSDDGQSGSRQDSQQHQGGSAESHGGMQDFLPAVQQALLLHLNQNQQDSDSQRTEGKDCTSLSRDKGKGGNMLYIYVHLQSEHELCL